MKPRKWSLQNAALYGAALGFPASLLRGLLSSEPLPAQQTDLVLYFSGAMLGGAMLFAVVAAIRNLEIK